VQDSARSQPCQARNDAIETANVTIELVRLGCTESQIGKL
jgi:hypothetical protein